MHGVIDRMDVSNLSQGTSRNIVNRQIGLNKDAFVPSLVRRLHEFKK